MQRFATRQAVLVMLTACAGAAPAQNLFFGSAGFSGSQNALYTTDLNGAGLQNILPSSMVVSGVAADGGAQMVFWQQPHFGQNQRQWALHAADFSGGSHTVIANWSSLGGNNYGVAVDRTNQRVFWTDGNGINSSNYNGTGATTLLTSYNPVDLEVDPAANKVFWITHGLSSVDIWSANLNGTSPTTIATLPANSSVNGLTVNPNTQTVFWSDYVGGTVSALPYTGGTPTTILSNYLYVQGLDYESTTNRLYIVNKSNASVAWMSPTGGPLTTVFTGAGITRGEMQDISVVVPAPASMTAVALAGVIALRRRRAN